MEMMVKPPEGITIRPATADDYVEITAVWSAAGLPFRPEGRESPAAFAHQVRRFAKTYLVAVRGGRIVGTVLGTHDVRKGWINRLAVVPECQRCGIASALVKACDAALRAEGIDIICALVEPENQASAALFRRLGYADDVPIIYFRRAAHPRV
jgi:ribosomal protein S18 acetylase RimI-like enzyme